MNKITIEMPLVSECMVTQCAYNVSNNCHARAITVGDSMHPGCDTFLPESQHIKDSKRIAGIGACKANSCKFNEDFECMAESIRVGTVRNEANCITYAMR